MARFGVGFLLGALVGGAAGAGGVYLATKGATGAAVPDAGRPAVALVAPDKPGKHKHSGNHGGGSGKSDSIDPSRLNDDDAPEVPLAAGDLTMAGEGDALHASAQAMDMGKGDTSRDLGQDEIDGAIAQRSSAIVDCLKTARGNAPVTGRIVAGMVVGANGAVVKTHVEAPAYLIHHGLGSCVRGQLAQIRFPSAGKETVVTVPFDLHE